MLSRALLLVLAAPSFVLGCNKTGETKATAVEAPPAAALPSSAAPPVSATRAEVGRPAPAFALKDTSGKTVTLSEHKGKTVVLEWFNPDCPFVKKSHEKGSLKSFANDKTKQGIVWLAINSGAVGKQGHGAARNAEAKTAWALAHPVLLDESGETGKLYGATNTPHMFVVDGTGVLRYAGAIDNSPDAEGDSPQGGKLVNYVEQALTELAAGRSVSVSTSKAYGCSVKY